MRGASVLFCLVVVASLVAIPLAGASDHENPPKPEQTFDGTEDVTVWNRSMLPLRANKSDAAAVVRAPNAIWSVQNVEDTADLPANRPWMGIYTRGIESPATIPLEYDLNDTFADPSDVNAEAFAGLNVTLVRGRVTENASSGAIPTTFQEGVDFLESENASNNVHFDILDRSQLDGEGSYNFTHEPFQPGYYVYFLATNETGRTGFQTEAGDLFVDGNASIIGIEVAAVEDGPSSYGPESATVTRGDAVTFNGTVPLWNEGGEAKHAVVLYHGQTFRNAQFRANMTDRMHENWTLQDNTTLEHSIADVNGVRTLPSNHTMFGVDLNDGRVARGGVLSSNLDFIAEMDAASPPANTEAIGSTVLDASINGTVADRNAPITVQTGSDWRADRYRWIHIAEGDDPDEIAMATGTLAVEAPSQPGGGGAPGGGGGGGAPPGPTGPGQPNMVITDASAAPNPAQVGETVTLSVTVENQGDTYGTLNVSLYVNDEYIGESREVALPAEENETVTIEGSFDAPGEYALRANNETFGPLVVEAPETPAPTTTEPPGPTDTPTGTAATTVTDTGLPGFGVTVAVVALLAAALLAARRD